MSGGMPELGSKISLISKADIRYEGRLFTLDPQECTIALSNVRSFGTEDRETQYRVAPQNEIYEYILFRGSDIKDIRVLSNVGSLPNDPAIVQLTVPPNLSGSGSYPGHGFLSHMGPSLTQYPPYNMGITTSGMGLHHVSRQPSELVMPTTANERDQDILHSSRPTTPIFGTRKSPTMDQGVQVGPNSSKEEKKPAPIQPKESSMRSTPLSDESIREKDHRDRGFVSMSNQQSMQPLPPRRPPPPRAAWVNRGGMRRGRPRGANRQPQNQQQRKTANTLKFEQDYDFEQANTEFEELRSQLAKTKISGGPTSTDNKLNGESEKKDDSGNETAIGDGDQDEEIEVYYDKTKSFFDNISCEAVERSKGRSQRTDWRTERKLNSETFGVASARRGGYRGRGYYGNRGFNRGGNMRGGYRGGNRSSGRGNMGNMGSQQRQTPQNKQLLGN